MSDAETERRDATERIRRGLNYALLGGLVLLGAFAAIQFYFAADRTINVWVTREFRPPFKMAFNLVVLLVVGVGLSRQLRRLAADDDEHEPNESSPEATADGGNTPSPGVARAGESASGSDDSWDEFGGARAPTGEAERGERTDGRGES